MLLANQDQANFWNSEAALRWVETDDSQSRNFANVTKTLLDAAELRQGDRVLDIGCGTGGATLAAVARTGAPALGVDLSGIMLARAGEILNEYPDSSITFRRADAQTETFEPATYDRMISRFGMMFFSDPVAAFRNIAAALKPGGRMAFICWGPADRNPWFAVPRKAAQDRLGAGATPAPNAPGPFGFADANWVLGHMRTAGLKDASCTALDIELTPGETIAEVVEFASLGPISSAMREKKGTPEDLVAIKSGLASALEDYMTPTGIRITGHFNLFTATV